MKIKNAIKIILKWLLLSLGLGVASGLFGALFAHSVSAVTSIRANNGWLIFLLPVGGLLSVFLYRFLRVQGVGTNQVLWSVSSSKGVSFKLAPAVFLGAVITHLCGGSAGREGAALQMGGGVASLFAKIFKLNEEERHIATVCGMAAFFSALFGTPLGAAVFAVEVIFAGKLCLQAILPALFASLSAFAVSQGLAVEPERFHLGEVSFSLPVLWKTVLIAFIGTAVAVIFSLCLHGAERLFKRLFKNEFVRIAVGGSVIILLTLAVGTYDYNGGGIDVIHRIFTKGEVNYEAFLLKVIFTCITVAAGYKGGEIVPTLFIGATLGGSLALVLGLTPAIGAAVGMAALFCGVTNCPVATVLLCSEMFGIKGLPFFVISVIISFFLSGKGGLYEVKKPYFEKNE